MNILVLDVAATESGALTVLNNYYDVLKKDANNCYYFCISTPEMLDTLNLTVLKFPWVKKSWIHRLWFELFHVKKLVKKHNIERVFSLQNLVLCHLNCEKWIYLHMPIPFTNISFSFFKDTRMWVYKHIIGKLIKTSLRKADHIIVQTRWMKSAVMKQADINEKVIEVIHPIINDAEIIKCCNYAAARTRLFYPAVPLKYKNHQVILDAMTLLKQRGKLGNLQLELTLTGAENATAQQLLIYVKQHELPVNFLGQLTRQQVQEMYSVSTLIFPSYIETFGLPLLEARLSNSPIIALDAEYSKEILDGYSEVKFFNYFDSAELAQALEDHMYSAY